MWFIIIVFIIFILAAIGKSLDYSSNSKMKYEINITISMEDTDKLQAIDKITNPENPMFAELQEELFDEFDTLEK